MDLGVPALRIKNRFESKPVKSRFLVRGLTAARHYHNEEIYVKNGGKVWSTSPEEGCSKKQPGVVLAPRS